MGEQPIHGWKVWGGTHCDHCCNGDRCDDRSHYDRARCPYCLGTGEAIWLKPTDNKEQTQ
jgi:hypothetical protein